MVAVEVKGYWTWFPDMMHVGMREGKERGMTGSICSQLLEGWCYPRLRVGMLQIKILDWEYSYRELGFGPVV